jgi:signal transduction histidine kinase
VRALRWSLLPAAVALGLYAEWAALRRAPLEPPASAAELRLAAADLAVGLVVVGAGLTAWRRRPGSRTGLLLCLTGFAWFLGTFAGSGWPGYAALGAFFLTLHRGVLAHALLTYPSGRLERRLERMAVAAAYALTVAGYVGETPAAALVLAGLLVAVGAERLRRSFGPERRARRTALVACAAFAAILVASAAARLASASVSLDWPYDAVIAGIAVLLALDLALGRWVRMTVTGLVVDLGEDVEPATLRERLAAALGDRSLELGYRLTDGEGYVDEMGREVALPRDDRERRTTIVRDGADDVAALVHDPDLVADPELLESVAAAARIAVANVHLQAEIRARVEELEASRRRLVEAGDAERRRLERQLREGAEHRLSQIQTLLNGAREGANGGLAPAIAELQATLERTRAELQEFAGGVHPRLLTEGGLAAALRDLVERSAVPAELSATDERFSPHVEAAAYFICSEALANTAKHAEATRVSVAVARRHHTLVVAVSDDGRGGARLGGGSGLRGLGDRVAALGGRLTVESPAGRGTALVAQLPV